MNRIKDFIFKEETGQFEYAIPCEKSVETINTLIIKSNDFISNIDMNLNVLNEKFAYRITSRNSPHSLTYSANMDFDLTEKENKTIVKYKISNSEITNMFFIILSTSILVTVLYTLFNLNELSSIIGIFIFILIACLFNIGMNRMDRGVVFDRYKRFIDKELIKLASA